MQTGLGYSHFARRYYGNRLLFLFLRVIRCFTSPGYLSDQIRVTPHYQRRVAPFGDPRIYGRLHLTVAFRSLPRPSSIFCAKASVMCPY